MKNGMQTSTRLSGNIDAGRMKPYILSIVLILQGFLLNAGNPELWGIDVTKSPVEISGCKVEQLEDTKVFSQLKICSEGYTFANDRPVYSCFYGDEASCFAKATEVVSSKYGEPLEVYSYNTDNPYSARTPFFNIWKYNKDDLHLAIMLFGSGEGMTLDVLHFTSEKKVRGFILSTIKSFHFAVKPVLYNYLDK